MWTGLTPDSRFAYFHDIGYTRMRTCIIPALVLLAATFGQSAGSPIAIIGEFSNMRYTEEHAYGYSIQLWRLGGILLGLFLASDGLAGDTPTGILENIEFDPATRKLSFQAKLTMGAEIIAGGKEEPSRDLFEFDGKLDGSELAGLLKHSNRLRSPAIVKIERIRLKRQAETAMETARTYQEWKARADGILKFRGPKW